jgi:hypothetical protein
MPESGPVTASLLTVALRVVRGAGALDPGRYTFQVRVTTPTGEADQTPAKVKFKVVPKKG